MTVSEIVNRARVVMGYRSTHIVSRVDYVTDENDAIVALADQRDRAIELLRAINPDLYCAPYHDGSCSWKPMCPECSRKAFLAEFDK